MVDGEGTPGNYLWRSYLLPEDIATASQIPKHPADWPKPKNQTKTGYYSTSGGSQQKAKAPSLPFGVRFQCPGCGHWYKESDLAGHAQVCPKTDGGLSMWAIECSCPCPSLDDTAKCKPGFPRKPPTPEAKKDAKKKPATQAEKKG